MERVPVAHQNGRESGVTLIEILVVMIVIGIPAAIAIPTFLSQRRKAHAPPQRQMPPRQGGRPPTPLTAPAPPPPR